MTLALTNRHDDLAQVQDGAQGFDLPATYRPNVHQVVVGLMGVATDDVESSDCPELGMLRLRFGGNIRGDNQPVIHYLVVDMQSNLKRQ